MLGKSYRKANFLKSIEMKSQKRPPDIQPDKTPEIQPVPEMPDVPDFPGEKPHIEPEIVPEAEPDTKPDMFPPEITPEENPEENPEEPSPLLPQKS
jgi:hypothetical protein